MMNSKYQISNIKYQMSKRKFISNWKLDIGHWIFLRGFTLVELLISSAIFITVSTVIVSVLFISFRVNTKTESLLSLRQAGNGVMEQMTNQIRFAARLEDPIDCSTPVTQLSITITSAFDDGQTIFACGTSTLASNSAELIDSNRYLVSNCSFTCSQRTPSDHPTITIQYTLTPASVTAGGEAQGTVDFKTAVNMRNFQQ